MTCRTPATCGPPSQDSTCDQQTGEWVYPGNLDIRTASLSCPLRIRGDLRVTETLTINGCARVRVDGTTTLGNGGNPQGVQVTFDLNDAGGLTPGQTTWLAAGRLVGGVTTYTARNIWDQRRTVQVSHQTCGNQLILMYTPTGQTRPAENCNPNPVVNNPVVNNPVVNPVNNGGNNGGGNVVGDDVVGGNDFADPAFGSDETDAFLAEDSSAAMSDEEFAAVGDSDTVSEAVGAFDDGAEANFDSIQAVDENSGDIAASDSANTNTASSSTASSAAPAYAFVLFALGVVVLVALVVVQVLIIKVKRAQEDVRM